MGICAICFQEKLGKLVSSSFPNTVFPSSSSSSPSFRSDINGSNSSTTITASATVHPADQNIEETTKKLEKMTTSFNIWPPSQSTRDAVIKRLIKTLSSKSVLSDRYGAIPSDEAAGVARSIEEEAFSAVPASSIADGDDGIEILHSYSKEISKRMLDFVKSRSVESVNDGATVDATASDGGKDEESSTMEI